MSSYKSKHCGYTGIGIYNGFILTKQFVDKQRNLTLKGTDPLVKLFDLLSDIALYYLLLSKK